MYKYSYYGMLHDYALEESRSKTPIPGKNIHGPGFVGPLGAFRLSCINNSKQRVSMGTDKTESKVTTRRPGAKTTETAMHDPSLLEKITLRVDSGDVELPTMSSIARYASRLRAIPDLSGRELQLLIEGEPAVASQVIRLANTAYYKPYGPRVTNLRMALVRLGNRSVANLIETIAMSDFCQHGPDGALRHLRQMWTNTLYSAIAARELATITKSADPEDAYLLGLFHNVGEPLLIRLLADEKIDGMFEDKNEQTLFGFMREWHEPMGKRLLHNWSFPQTAVDLAGDHHGTIDSDLQALVCLSFESALSYGYSYFDHRPHDDRRTLATEKLGLDEEALDALRTDIGTTLNEALGITVRL